MICHILCLFQGSRNPGCWSNFHFAGRFRCFSRLFCEVQIILLMALLTSSRIYNGHLYVSHWFFPYHEKVTVNMSGYLFLVVMCVKTSCVHNIINTFPPFLTPHRLHRYKRQARKAEVTSLANLDQSCLVSMLLISIGQRYINNGMTGMTFTFLWYGKISGAYERV